MTAMRWVVLVSVASSCAPDLCAEVTCRRPPAPTCLSEAELETPRVAGTCEPSTGECTWREPVVTRCLEGERCSEGACRCVPSLCGGCCEPNGGCAQGARLTEQTCGVGGVTCQACSPGAVCVADAGCVACPPEHVVQRHACVDDDVQFDVSLAGATRWPPPPFDGGVTLWHHGPADDVVVNVAARSLLASVNDLGVPQLQLPVSLRRGMTSMLISIRAPSGRTAVHELSVIPSRAIARAKSYYASCFVTPEAEVDCAGQRSDAGQFVAVGSGCGLTVEGKMWCVEDGGWSRRFSTVPEIVDIALPCVRTRSQFVFCEETDGGVRRFADSRYTAVECRSGACCVLDEAGEARCWGNHPYNLFDRPGVYPTPAYPDPTWVVGLPSRYDRLSSGEKTFFGQLATGEWSAASNRMGFPTVPFVIPEAGATSLKLDSPYYCIMGLEPDGGLWTTDYAYSTTSRVRRPVDAGAAVVIDFAPGPQLPGSFFLLTADHQVLDFTCPP